MADETGALSRVLELAEEPTAPAPTVAEAVDAAVVGEARPKPRAATQQGFLNAVVGMAYLWHAMDDEVDGMAEDQDQESSSMETVEIEPEPAYLVSPRRVEIEPEPAWVSPRRSEPDPGSQPDRSPSHATGPGSQRSDVQPSPAKAEEKKLAKPRLVSKRPASALRKPAASGKRQRLEPLPEGVVAGCSKCKYKASGKHRAFDACGAWEMTFEDKGLPTVHLYAQHPTVKKWDLNFVFDEDSVVPIAELEDGSDDRSSSELAQSAKHQFHHFPKNPFCKVCQRARMLAPQARKKGGESRIQTKASGDHLIADHVVARANIEEGNRGERVGLVVKDLHTKFRSIYPAQCKSSDEVVVALQHFVVPDDAVEVIYTDNSRELIAGIKELGYRHQTSVEYVDSLKSFVEREVRNMLEGARTNLVQSGMPLQYWPLAVQHFAMATNTSDQLDSSPSP
ncbi:Uncharacterized protein SCF082_LOCUS12576 [Durusdinium trenchii]|uniref:Integrase catalytic domain-containing protein n=1 Tax=Durusdinium trenchii TaxID=1381693 RepID=A0ABP0JL80_9DINO